MVEVRRPYEMPGTPEAPGGPGMAARLPPQDPRPKIIFVNRYFFPDLSATSQMLTDMAAKLGQAGIDVHVICSRQLYEDPDARLPAHELVGHVRVHRVWTSSFGRQRLAGRALDYASFYLTCTARMFALAHRSDILVVKTDPPLLSIPGALVARLRGATLVNWLQDVFPEVATELGMAPWPRWFGRMLRGIRDRSLAAARTNIVLGERMRDLLLARGVAAGQVHIVENWADGQAVGPLPPAASELRRRLGFTGRFVVAYSGNLGRAHESDTIIEAAQQLSDDPAFVFLMIGGGAKMRELQDRVRERGLTHFRFLPYQPREVLADSLAAADVHLACLLPQMEGLIVPSKVYGVLAAGRPMIFIGDPEGELARILRDGQCGVTVKCGDGAGLAQVLRTWRADAEALSRMGSSARELFDQRYTLDSAFGKWLDLLSRIEPAGRWINSERTGRATA